MLRKSDDSTTIGRRAFLKNGALVLSTTVMSSVVLSADDMNAGLRIGLVTDLHYADKPPAGTRHYRETPEKLAAAAEHFDRANLDFIVELGDLIDAAESVETELCYLKQINQDFSRIHPQRHYVLGNHCVYSLTKQEFLEGVGQEHSYHSFDKGAYHFVVLDSCFRSDGEPYGRNNFEWTDPNIPATELEWLKADLSGTSKPTIVFAHQRLDVGSPYGVKNASDVRHILEGANVLAVMQGHSHKNEYREIGGIHYCTLVAMIEGSGVENNGFSTLHTSEDGILTITGFCHQASYRWEAQV